MLKDKSELDLGIELTEDHVKKFKRYATLLLEWNEKINLTSITEPAEVVTKHFLDSLVFVRWIDRYYSNSEPMIADLGTGAGFPGIPIKIVRPKTKIVLIDALAKRINFLNEIINELKLEKVEICHARAEDIGRHKKYREIFDLTVARAVAELPVLLEYATPLLKVNGRFIAAKGIEPEKEIRLADKAMLLLNCELEHVENYSLAEGADYRSLIIIKKIKNTPAKYPRQAGKPKKDPL
ncbi:16S rRNA (guanine(527)-N(7))-methyltransferase RsmG [Dehalobacter sp. DCM]|uniref:16S rRNA (guanine(527)-N(7))-methyltransferase RsmG n=1 Tax=Dehalobacter sp. DCM TaxID=2907827 RepID=UPI003081A806|nr:16S rRNA (guanine(527)-N(7))-methyltransferase RsmG [Dehalobacter sp. DCM]